MSRGIRVPLAILAVACAAFVGDVLSTADQLPAKVATHFNAQGVPDGWMTRSAHARGMIGFGIGVPVFIVLLFWIMRAIGGSYINLPHRDYWLAPERRQQTLDSLLARGLWLACLLVVFAAALNRLIVAANLRNPVELPPGASGWLMAGIIGGTVAWVIALLVRFARRPDGAKA